MVLVMVGNEPLGLALMVVWPSLTVSVEKKDFRIRLFTSCAPREVVKQAAMVGNSLTSPLDVDVGRATKEKKGIPGRVLIPFPEM